MGLYEFKSIGDLARWCDEPEHRHIHAEYHGLGKDGGWKGKRSFNEMIVAAKEGDISYVPKAEKLLEQINTQIEAPERTISPAPAGGYPVVADYLAGSPTPMRVRDVSMEETSPIRIFVNIGCSASVKAHDMERRGTAALALAMAMQRVRPVELWIWADLGSRRRNGKYAGVCMPKVLIGTSPLSIAHASVAMCDPGTLRHLSFCLHAVENKTSTIPWAKDHPYQPLDQVGPDHPYVLKVREWLDASEGDVILGGEFSATGMIFTDPLQWVQLEIDKHLYQQEEGMH